MADHLEGLYYRLRAHLLAGKCPTCHQPALEAHEAEELVDDLDIEELMSANVVDHVLNVARYEVSHWPFCWQCNEDFMTAGDDPCA
jgi:hypothetical protein